MKASINKFLFNLNNERKGKGNEIRGGEKEEEEEDIWKWPGLNFTNVQPIVIHKIISKYIYISHLFILRFNKLFCYSIY